MHPITDPVDPRSAAQAGGSVEGAAGARWFGEVRAFVVRHPRWVDGMLAAAIGLVNAHRSLEGSGVVGVACYVVVHLILAWRRAAPVAVCWSVFGLSLLTLLLVGIRVEGLYPEAVIAVAVYTVARHGPLRHLVPIVVVVETLALSASLVAGPQWTAVGFVTFGLAAAVLLGLVVRTRRAYLAELEDRARRLERDRDQRAEIAVAAERARIARDMHDIVAHHLSVMVTLADAATLTAGTSPDDAVAAMRHVSGTGRQALGEMRRVLGLLHTDPDPHPAPQPQPGLADLDALVAGVRAAGLRVEVTVEGVPGDLGAGAELAVYRITQEALTNVLKHAGVSSRSEVRLRYTGGRVELEVTDDGPGAPGSGGGPDGGRDGGPDGGWDGGRDGGWDGGPGDVAVEGRGDGRGMTGMAARAAAYGGRFTAGPRPGGRGWSVRATLDGGGGEDGP
ncbi:histidine kinase [Dactylosporangium sp. NBC_01737]|uniref:sensor histidine kinase n=1 Tax=Dactylosporangium sp. NBC_01737 TaxID=2975959 RepID=UPI002E0DE506|nr:histidine kinase [Dactylosporangium sp. NBC_01737]